MKKLLIILIVLLFAGAAHAETYSKGMFGAGFGNEDVCLFSQGGCFNDSTSPALNTDTGYYFYVVPLAVRKDLHGDIGIRMESEFSVSRREFNLEAPIGEESKLTVDGDDTRYSFGGNLLLDYKIKDFNNITPYIGAGVGLEYAKLTADFSACGCSPGPIQLSTHDDFGRYWKWIAGVEVPIVGNLKGNVEYNYRLADRFKDDHSTVNWNMDGNHIVNAGLTLYW